MPRGFFSVRCLTSLYRRNLYWAEIHIPPCRAFSERRQILSFCSTHEARRQNEVLNFEFVLLRSSALALSIWLAYIVYSFLRAILAAHVQKRLYISRRPLFAKGASASREMSKAHHVSWQSLGVFVDHDFAVLEGRARPGYD